MADHVRPRLRSPRDIQSIKDPKEFIVIPQPDQGDRSHIAGLAVSPLSGKLFLTDDRRHKILVFNQERMYIASFGTQGQEEGELDRPMGIAVDLKGLVYVANVGNDRIEVFREDGTFARQIGSGQLNSPEVITFHNELLYIGDTGNDRVSVYTLQGEHVCFIDGLDSESSPRFDSIRGIAFSPNGHMYVLSDRVSPGVVHIFSSTGLYHYRWELEYEGMADDGLPANDIAITNNGDILIAVKDKESVLVFSSHNNCTNFKFVRSLDVVRNLTQKVAIDHEENILVVLNYPQPFLHLLFEEWPQKVVVF